MSQTPEAQIFLDRVLVLPNGPGQPLDDVLQPSLNDEAELRRLFAADKTNARLSDIHVGLVNIFSAPQDIRITRARVVDSDDDLAAKYVMPLPDNRRRKEGEPAMVQTLEEFNKNWAIFTEGSLSQLHDWNNVVAAGGSALACLSPLPESAKVSNRALRKYFHGDAYPSSDIDLFLYGLSPQEAEVKINQIYEAVRDSVPWDCTCVRTKHTVSIHSQFPYRCIQIVLRLYQSPAEVLAGFDVDAPCCAYDGSNVWANPRAIVAMMRQCNTVDMTRRSPSYEVRLSKYSARGFEVYVPGLRRADVDPTIYERSISRIQGLARLLVLEKLQDVNSREAYLGHRRKLRSRPQPNTPMWTMSSRSYKGDLKQNLAASALQMNDYDVGNLHIPYGPGWDVNRIEKLIYQTDLGMNSPYNPKNKYRRLHRHPAWFGTMTECLDDLCSHCPDPLTDQEKSIQEDEDKIYLRGRVQFIQDNPGRQTMTGSFNPIDIGEWSGDAYIGDTAKFFNAIASFDRAGVRQMIQNGTADVNRRDHVGRTPLHLAVLVKAVDIACDLIDNGARISARVVDGRSALHMAARLDLPVVVRKLLERSSFNVEESKGDQKYQAKEGEGEHVAKNGPVGVTQSNEDEGDDDDEEDNYERCSSDDDWSSVDRKPKKKEIEVQECDRGDVVLLEDDARFPDLLDVNLADWDLSWPPLFHAVAAGSLSVIEELLAAGVDVKVLSTFVVRYHTYAFHPLTLAILTEDDARACEVVELLLKAGAVSTATDENMLSIFHRFVCSGRSSLVSTLLRADPNSKAAINFPTVFEGAAVFPLVTALNKGSYSLVAILLAHGAKVNYTETDLLRVRTASSPSHRWRLDDEYLKAIARPIETAIAHRDLIAYLLLKLDCDIKLPIRQGLVYTWSSARGLTYLEWIRSAVQNIDERLRKIQFENSIEKAGDVLSTTKDSWRSHCAKVVSDIRQAKKKGNIAHPGATQTPIMLGSMGQSTPDDERTLIGYKEYLQNIEMAFVKLGARAREVPMGLWRSDPGPVQQETIFSLSYDYILPGANNWDNQRVPKQAFPAYDGLFQSCWDGDNARIQQLCFPKVGPTSLVQPLQISVKMVWSESTFTPLHAAIYRRKWETARLIMAIATSQYKSEESVLAVETRDIALDDESENEPVPERDYEMEPRKVNYVDIASRPSTIHTGFSPQKLLDDCRTTWLAEDGSKIHTESLLHQSIEEGDLEAFVQICEIYRLPPGEASVSLSTALDWIILYDRPEMLDDFIRRTGVGIELPRQGSGGDTEEHYELFASGRRVYLGLTVHGRKRKYLAARRYSSARQNNQALVMRAAMNGANNLLKYLHGQRPLEAYRYFASTNREEGTRLKAIPDLSAVLSQSLGWTINVLNESPLAAAILGDKLETVKLLFDLFPSLMDASLRARIKFCRFTMLLVAADRGCSPELFDYLLSLNVSVMDVDHRGWNIYHLAAAKGHKALLAHMLKILPADVTEMLLTQQSKYNLNTPLHLAVKAGKINVVKLFAEHQNASFMLQDINGFTPLYAAVTSGIAEVTEVLCRVSPKETLYMENSVGDTIPETAAHLNLYDLTHKDFPGHMESIRELDHSGPMNRPLVTQSLEERERNVVQLRSTLDQLVAEGRLIRETKPTIELLEFAKHMEALLVEDKEEPQPMQETSKITQDRTKTAEHILAFVGAAAGSNLKRTLCHVLDVHKSVENHLRKTRNDSGMVDSSGGLVKPAVDEEDSERQKSLLFNQLNPYSAFGADMN